VCGKHGMTERNVGFTEAVLESFSWLEVYEYRPVEVKQTLVRYEGACGEVTVYHGRSSWEIGVEVGPPHGAAEIRYSMSALVQLVDQFGGREYRNPGAAKPEIVRRFVKEQADRLEQYGSRIFAGDSSIWQELADQERRARESLGIATRLARAIPEADRRFRERDYEGVVELLSPYEVFLSQTHRKKLSYARRHVPA